MRRAELCLLSLLSCAGASLTRAQAPELPPHSWLFGAWFGGLFPPPVSVSAQECLAQPAVIFTRDLVLRATFIDVTYVQRQVDTVRAIPGGTEFRLIAQTGPVAGGGTLLTAPTSAPAVGFGCETPDVLHVQRHGENQISFPHCAEFPYPLIRCPAR
jgi:hypothetical protein